MTQFYWLNSTKNHPNIFLRLNIRKDNMSDRYCRISLNVFKVTGKFTLSTVCQFKDLMPLMCLQCAEWRALMVQSYISESHSRSLLLLLLETKELDDHSRHMSRERHEQGLSADISTAVRERHEWGVLDSLEIWLSLSNIAWNYSANNYSSNKVISCSTNCCSIWTTAAKFDIFSPSKHE